jgi:AcrR family transcriptional regulator
MNETGTKIKLLDAAEKLFARNGYRGTSLRAITGKAGANLAAVNYHFGSKEALLEAVLERRIAPLNRVRMERIRAVRDHAAAKGERPPVAGIIHGFVEPTLRFRDNEPGAGDFITLVGRSFADPDDTVRKGFHRMIGPFAGFLIESVKEALPDMPEGVLVMRMHFAMGAFAHTLCNMCDTEAMPEHMRFPDKNDTDKLVDELVGFVTAGLEGVKGEKGAKGDDGP